MSTRPITTHVTPLAGLGGGDVVGVDGRSVRPVAVSERNRLASLRLASLNDVAGEQARVYKRMASGTITSQDGSRLVWALSQLARTIELATIEEKLAEAQALIDSINSGTFAGGHA